MSAVESIYEMWLTTRCITDWSLFSEGYATARAKEVATRMQLFDTISDTIHDIDIKVTVYASGYCMPDDREHMISSIFDDIRRLARGDT